MYWVCSKYCVSHRGIQLSPHILCPSFSFFLAVSTVVGHNSDHLPQCCPLSVELLSGRQETLQQLFCTLFCYVLWTCSLLLSAFEFPKGHNPLPVWLCSLDSRGSQVIRAAWQLCREQPVHCQPRSITALPSCPPAAAWSTPLTPALDGVQ